MAQRLKYFLVVLLLMFAKENFSQINNIDSVKICIPPLQQKAITLKGHFESFIIRHRKVRNENSKYLIANPFSRCIWDKNYSNKNYYLTTAVSPSIYFNVLESNLFKQVAFFCIAEDKFEKQTSIPLRIRLGSLDYTNYLEQKPNAVKPSY